MFCSLLGRSSTFCSCFFINKIWCWRPTYSQPPLPRFQVCPGNVEMKGRPDSGKRGSYSGTGRQRQESSGGKTTEPQFGCYFPPRGEANPGGWGGNLAITQPPFVTGEGAPEHSDCQQNGSQSGFICRSADDCFAFCPSVLKEQLMFRDELDPCWNAKRPILAQVLR